MRGAFVVSLRSKKEEEGASLFIQNIKFHLCSIPLRTSEVEKFYPLLQLKANTSSLNNDSCTDRVVP